jgi:hypothetical protein
MTISRKKQNGTIGGKRFYKQGKCRDTSAVRTAGGSSDSRLLGPAAIKPARHCVAVKATPAAALNYHGGN